MATTIAGSSSPPCPLGISAATRRSEGLLELPRLRLRGVEGVTGRGGQGSPARAAAERVSLARLPGRCAFASQSARPEPGSLGQHGGVAAALRAAGRGRRSFGVVAVGFTPAAPSALRAAGKGTTLLGPG